MKARRNIQKRSVPGQKRQGEFFPNPKGKGLFFKKEKQNNDLGVPSVPTVQMQPTKSIEPELTQDPAVKSKSSPFPEFDFKEVSEEMGRFDASYTPVAPFPEKGVLNITLWVHITFEDFSSKRQKKEPYKSHKFTEDQLADFNWKEDERVAFETDFMTNVEDGWSNKHILTLNDPFFAPYQSEVEVTVITISDPELANVKMKALKVPKGAPRFRSFVSGDEATLDIRDPSEEEDRVGEYSDMLRQIGSFGFDSDAITPALKDQIKEVADFIKNEDPNPEIWSIGLGGRASSQGNSAYNEALSERRSEAVRKQLFLEIGWGEEVANYISMDPGEENATTEAKFRRVDLVVTKIANLDKNAKLKSNTAAHEAGHMFGLGDEYIEEKDETPKFLGDKPTHYNVVKDLIDENAANELLVHNSDSIMSHGQVVKRGHYVSFLAALNKLTNKKWGI